MDRGDWSQPWQDPEFCVRLSQTEAQHVQVQAEHERARRELEMARRDAADELMRLWISYRRVLDELECTTAALESLRLEAYVGISVPKRAAPPAPEAAGSSVANAAAFAAVGEATVPGVDLQPVAS